MAKGKSADTLLKHLQKIERAQGRLNDITTRIRVQAETLAELLKVARAFVTEAAAPKPTDVARPTAPSRKAASPSTRSAPRRTAARARTKGSTPPGTARRPKARAQATTSRRAPRKAASA